MSYNYGPPPPPPPTAAPSNPAYPAYGQSYQQQRGGHAGRGRGGPSHGGRGGYQAPQYGYGGQPAQQPQYPQAGAYPTAGAYPAQPTPQVSQHQQQQAQQWHGHHGQQNNQSSAASQAPILAQNYHPNFAPQLYQQQPNPSHQQYPAQPPYGGGQPGPQYGQGYQPPSAPNGPPVHQWNSHSPPPDQQFGRGRGGYNDRGGHRAQMMGPPIRMGFEAGNPHGHHAPVSNTYPPQPYGGHQSPPSYPPAYGAYAPPPPFASGQPQHDGRSHYGPRHRGGGGGGGPKNHSNHNQRGRPQFGGDKSRNHNRGPPQHNNAPKHHQKPDAAAAGKKKKRKTNLLGLTPGDESEEDDENEEERLVEMIGSYVSNPTSSAEIVAWIAERRANFPTKARVDAKRAVEVQTKSTKDADDVALEKQAEKLRKQLEKVEATMKRKREAQDEGDEMRNVEAGSDDSKSGGDDAPEAVSSKAVQATNPPPNRKADPTKHCKYYSTGGTCGKKGKCRFVHDPAVREAALKEREANGGRMTLSQRLVLNDKEQEDLSIVQSLKYLQDRGILQHGKGAGAAAEETEPSASEPSKLPPPDLGLPPIPPPSVVQSGSAPKYNGWNLSGFGNTGVKPDE